MEELLLGIVVLHVILRSFVLNFVFQVSLRKAPKAFIMSLRWNVFHKVVKRHTLQRLSWLSQLGGLNEHVVYEIFFVKPVGILLKLVNFHECPWHIVVQVYVDLLGWLL